MAIIDNVQKISDTVCELPSSYKAGMRVPARITHPRWRLFFDLVSCWESQLYAPVASERRLILEMDCSSRVFVRRGSIALTITSALHFAQRSSYLRYGRGLGVGRGRGVGVARVPGGSVAVGDAVAVALAVGDGVAVPVAVGDAVGV